MRYFLYPLAFTLLVACMPVAAQAPLKPRDPSVSGPQTFAIVLGVSKYKFVRPLAYADKWDPLESTCRHASLSIL